MPIWLGRSLSFLVISSRYSTGFYYQQSSFNEYMSYVANALFYFRSFCHTES